MVVSAPRLRLGLLGLAVALVAVTFASPSPAHASVSEQYCGPQWVGGYNRCPTSSSKHSWETNDTISSQGPWPMCERMEDWYDGNSIYSRNCANTVDVGGYWDDFCGGCQGHNNPGYYLRCWAGNNTQFYGNIRGIAAYGVF